MSSDDRTDPSGFPFPSRPSGAEARPLSWAATTPVASPPAPPTWMAGTPTATLEGAAPADAGSARPRRRTPATILGAAVLSALLASGSTLAIVELALPHGATPTAAATPNANATAQGGAGTTLQAEDITSVVAAAKDSVVTLTSQIATNRGPFGDGTATGIGSGIILTADGYVLTNRHVVEGTQSLTATLADGAEYPASVVTISDKTDLALVKVQATGLKAATIGDSGAVAVGQTAIAIGSPLGTYTETVTKGIVSALNRTITVRDEETGRPTTLNGLIQTDAAINQGNSGGPLLNGSGDVVGVNTATASSAEGIGFAIPIREAQTLIEQARSASVA